jgi:hypothetical protein
MNILLEMSELNSQQMNKFYEVPLHKIKSRLHREVSSGNKLSKNTCTSNKHQGTFRAMRKI